MPRAFRLQERFDYLAYISIRKLLEQIALREVPIDELGRGVDFLRELETLGFIDLHYKDEIPQSCTLAREAFDDIKAWIAEIESSAEGALTPPRVQAHSE